ncbi:hypothetical protein BJQ94_19305 [Cryobacterium sp. SO2]|uniref:hypothetical protein n=1 Tax=Cryobacterium sp. SO2 TaxID=1897060 RepID=UPI00223E2871|nr:hypothetical protein [Cryobacterium sp. SO2]WEO77469.1 hypothetical protein BJQ94_19305 [Cryobacterium sp. SO2]
MDPDDSPLMRLQLTRDNVGHDGRARRREHERGDVDRLRRGIYVAHSTWSNAGADARYLMRIHAAVLSRRTRPVVSHLSAARLWGLPVLGQWPPEVHLQGGSGQTRTSKNWISWHHDPLPDDDVTEIDGLLVTTRLRTMVDLARSQPFRSAVISLDAGLQDHFVLPGGTVVPAISRDAVFDRVLQLGSRRGARRARQSVEFADARSGSVGESLSRTGFLLAGMPMPDLQVVYPHAFGEDRVDFRWKRRYHVRKIPLLGEFDGELKYTRGEFMGGRTINEVVWAEKRREDRLRAPGRSMARWLWVDALRPERLRAVLLNAGLRPDQ